MEQIKQEHVPEIDEVLAVFREFIGGVQQYQELERKSDERGLYLFDIKIELEDGCVEYSYARQGTFLEGSPTQTAVYRTYFDPTGEFITGSSVAIFENNKWKILDEGKIKQD